MEKTPDSGRDSGEEGTGRADGRPPGDERAREERDRLSPEAALLRRRLDALLGVLSDMAWVKDAEGRYVEANEAFVQFVGRPREEVLGRTDADLFEPDRARRYARGDREALEGGRPVETAEEIVDRTGKRIILSISRRPIGEPGSPNGLVGLIQDWTARRDLERRLLQSQKMDAIGRLAGGVAHDFNNILTAMTGYAEILLGELAPDDERRANVVEIRTAVERAATLTRQLLAFSRQQVLEPRVLDINELIRNVGRMLHRLIGENIELFLPGPGKVWPVLADPGQIEQIVVNLAVNARDAMPHGGKLLIETENTRLEETAGTGGEFLVAAGEYVLLAVSDTGVGMSPNVRKHLFEPFFTTKERGKGTGLGLSTVYGIVKQSGGYVWVYSEEGLGTVFKIFLPRVDREFEPVDAPRPEIAVKRGSETILLVEDEPEVRSLVEKLLKRDGYRVISAAHPEEALELVRAGGPPIDLLLTDVVMPGMSGRDLAGLLTREIPNLRILYVSGYTDDGVVHQGILEPGLAFLQKPFSPAALARKIREVLEAPPPGNR